jgi:predicted pyridoxine 5'-phosphate oxidase superfamily flavin-nucleotide-binding protein
MPRRFNDLAFTPHVKAQQIAHGSRAGYAYRTDSAPDVPDELGQEEREFIEARDSFYLSTVSETGWPYVQHRGGPIGFLRVIDPHTIGFADLAGNKQYISLGNLETNDRAALFLMDYPNRTRLKILAHAKIVERESDPELVDSLAVPGYRGKVERAMIFAIEGFSWNCQQHITPRYTVDEIAEYRPETAP